MYPTGVVYVFVTVLCGGAAIRVTLRGIATQEDLYREERQKIEEELAKREALQTARRILDGILDGVRTPERPSSPVDAYITVSFIVTMILGQSSCLV